jgi:hypothetical protein
MEAKALAELYNQMYGLDKRTKKDCLIEMAGKLSKISGRERPWTWRFLNSLLNSDKGFSISPEMERAIGIAERRLDGQSEAQARAREIMVLTTNGIEPGSIVFGHTTRCYCGLPVVFNHPGRKYCFEECLKRARQERRVKAASM